MDKGIFKKQKNIDIDIYYKLVNDYANLQNKLEEKDKVIDEAIKLANDILVSGWDYVEKDNICIKLLEILERDKNVNSK